MKAEIPEIDPEIPANAVSVYGSDDAADDFPVLKAFQQYIDAEQTKARKRMLMLCTFFGVIMIAVIGFFMYVLHNADADKAALAERNQALNDKLVDYAIKDRDRERNAPYQENAAVQALTAKLESLQKQLAETKSTGPSAAELEVEKFRAQLAIEKEKAAIEQAKLEVEREKQLRVAAEKERQRLVAEQEKARLAAEQEKQHQQELEAYRRKHYPEFYAPKKPDSATAPSAKVETQPSAAVKSPSPSAAKSKKKPQVELSDADIDEILKNADWDDDEAVSYFDSDDDTDTNTNGYSIPVDVKGSSSKWEIPE